LYTFVSLFMTMHSFVYWRIYFYCVTEFSIERAGNRRSVSLFMIVHIWYA